jgi:hypothetical protein
VRKRVDSNFIPNAVLHFFFMHGTSLHAFVGEQRGSLYTDAVKMEPSPSRFKKEFDF